MEINPETTAKTERKSYSYGGNVYDYAFMAMVAAYNLYSANAADLIGEIEDRNEQIRYYRALKQAIRNELNGTGGAGGQPPENSAPVGSLENPATSRSELDIAENYQYYYYKDGDETKRIMKMPALEGLAGEHDIYLVQTYTGGGAWGSHMLETPHGEIDLSEFSNESGNGFYVRVDQNGSFLGFSSGSNDRNAYNGGFDEYGNIAWLATYEGTGDTIETAYHWPQPSDGTPFTGPAVPGPSPGGGSASGGADSEWEIPDYSGWSKEALEAELETLEEKISSLSSFNQIDLIKLQKIINDMNLVITLLSNLLKAEKDTKEGIVRNI